MKRLTSLYIILASSALTLVSLNSCVKENPQEPDAVVSKADWQDVQPSTGSIELNDITLSFPSGTFGNDDQVAITKVRAGSIGKDDEKSEFYQVTMPENGSAKPVTVSIRYDGDPSEVRAVLRTQFYCISGGKMLKESRIVDSEYKDGAINITIPETYSSNGQNAQFTVGLVPADESGDDAATKAVGKEWTYDWNLWSWQKSTYRPYRKQINEFLAQWVPDAQSKLYARGFEIPPIYYEMSVMDDETWGGYMQPAFFKTSGYIRLNAKKFMSAVKDKESPDYVAAKSAIIHETLHASHTLKYNPDLALPSKFWTLVGYEYTMFTEALAVWSEQFMRDPKVLKGSPVAEEENYLPFIQTFYPQGLYPGNSTYQNYGYAMAAFIQYLAKKTSQKSIVRLAQLQKEGEWGVSDIFECFLKENKLDFFETESFLEYALMYCKGDLVEDITYKRINNSINCSTSAPVSLNYNVTGPKVYSCGFVPQALNYKEQLLKDYEDYSLGFDQKTEGLETHVWYVTGESDLVYAGKAIYDEPFLLPISKLVKKSSQSVLTITVKSLMTNDDSYLRSSVTVSFEPPVPKPKTVRVAGKVYVSSPDLNEGVPTVSQIGGVMKETGNTFKSELRNKDKDLYVSGHYTDSGNEFWIQFDIIDWAKMRKGQSSLGDIEFRNILTGSMASGLSYKNTLSLKVQALDPKKGDTDSFFNSGNDLSVQFFKLLSTTSYGGSSSTNELQYVKHPENELTITVEMEGLD
ncbi:MAG: hypothetical protein IKZ91_03685 [Bacteroidales bacterium]|nr:hypothetical protein [Bacteroidales bacterium]